jgi:hypothetical protein
MGYYSQMEINLKVKKEKIEILRKEIERLNQEYEEKMRTRTGIVDSDLIVYFLTELDIDDEGYFNFPIYYDKWYGNEEFVKFIADYVNEGTLIFTGEDGEKWGYMFDGKGKVYNLIFKTEKGELFYETS